MSKFKVGDRVVCRESTHSGLVRGAEYVVRAVGRYHVWLVGYSASFFEERFDLSTRSPSHDYDQDHEAFFAACKARHEAGKATYGNKSWESSAYASLKDMEEELFDFANYAAHLYSKLQRMREALDKAKQLLTDEKE